MCYVILIPNYNFWWELCLFFVLCHRQQETPPPQIKPAVLQPQELSIGGSRSWANSKQTQPDGKYHGYPCRSHTAFNHYILQIIWFVLNVMQGWKGTCTTSKDSTFQCFCVSLYCFLILLFLFIHNMLVLYRSSSCEQPVSPGVSQLAGGWWGRERGRSRGGALWTRPQPQTSK